MEKPSGSSVDSLIEPLTRREREILGLLADSSLSNPEIAQRLVLAPNSVKWYTNKIYGKLGASTRKEALAKARERGLLPQALPAGPGAFAAAFAGAAATSAPAAAHNLPAPLTPFIGRQGQVEQVSRMLCPPAVGAAAAAASAEAPRLVTLTGAGGVGKTRLALQVAEKLHPVYPQGAWLVELAGVNDEQFVADAAAAVFGLRVDGARSAQARLRDFLQGKQLLLVLDNCEHLVASCAGLVEDLLQYCRDLRILVTSREALNIAGEIPFVVPSLSFPDRGCPPGEADLSQYEAVRLFVDRANAILPGFSLTGENAGAVTRICQKLAGIPLALELAAARLKVLDVAQLADQLEESFDLLAGGSRTALPRHRTMRASIEWSYNLLSAGEQKLLRRLSVFTGSWPLEAAETMVWPAGNFSSATLALSATMALTSPEDPLIDLLTSLIDKSMLTTTQTASLPCGDAQAADSGGNPRCYRMLEPIRQYASEKLAESGEEQAARRRHLEYALLTARQAELELCGKGQAAWLNRLEHNLDNIRLALDWGLKTDVAAELRMAAALMRFWHIHGRWSEGGEWLSRGLAAPASANIDPRVRARALAAAGYLQRNYYYYLNDFREYGKAIPLLQESLAIYQQDGLEDPTGLAFTLLQLARCSSDPLQTAALANESLGLYRSQGDAFGISECLLCLGMNEKEPLQAKAFFQKALALKKSLGDTDGTAVALTRLGHSEKAVDYFRTIGNKRYVAKIICEHAWFACLEGNHRKAFEYIEEAIAIYRETQEDTREISPITLRSKIYLSLGDLRQAAQDAGEALRMARETGNRFMLAHLLAILGKIAGIEGKLRQASALLNDAIKLSQEIGFKKVQAEAQTWLGNILSAGDELDAALPLLKDSLRIFFELGYLYWDMLAYPLDSLAAIAMGQQDFRRAARCYSAADNLLPLYFNMLHPAERARRESDLALLKIVLGEVLFEQYWHEGHSFTVQQILEYAQN